MPTTLTSTCAVSEPELIVSRKCATKDRKMPTQNTASDCWPHLIIGRNTFHSRPGQSFGRNRTTRKAISTKCSTRYGARKVLSFGLNASYSQLGNISPNAGKRPAMVITSANSR